MSDNLQQTILRNVLTNETYMRKVLPFIQPDYFTGIHQKLFKELASFVAKYNKLPTEESFRIEVDQSDRFANANDYTEASSIIPDIFKIEPIDEKWLDNTTEKWCQDQAVHKAVLEAITVIDGKHKFFTEINKITNESVIKINGLDIELS